MSQKIPPIPTFIAAYPIPGSKRSLYIAMGAVLLIAVIGAITFYYVKRNSSSQDH